MNFSMPAAALFKKMLSRFVLSASLIGSIGSAGAEPVHSVAAGVIQTGSERELFSNVYFRTSAESGTVSFRITALFGKGAVAPKVSSVVFFGENLEMRNSTWWANFVNSRGQLEVPVSAFLGRRNFIERLQQAPQQDLNYIGAACSQLWSNFPIIVNEIVASGRKDVSEALSFSQVSFESFGRECTAAVDLIKSKRPETTSTDTRIGQLERKVREITSEISNLPKGQNEELQEEVTYVRAEQAKITARVKALEESLVAAEKTAREALAGAAELSSRLRALETALGDIKKPTASSDWPQLPAAQERFCAIFTEYEAELAVAQTSGNQIRSNLVVQKRDADLLALLPSGQFTNWVLEIAQVYQDSDGNAAFVLETQCGKYLGSAVVSLPDGTTSWYASAREGDPIFNQLARVSIGDKVIASGKLFFIADLNSSKGGRGDLAFVSTLSSGVAASIPPNISKSLPVQDVDSEVVEPELFLASINYLARL